MGPFGMPLTRHGGYENGSPLEPPQPSRPLRAALGRRTRPRTLHPSMALPTVMTFLLINALMREKKL